MSIFRDLDIDKYKVILNNSRDINKNYFSLFDIYTGFTFGTLPSFPSIFNTN